MEDNAKLQQIIAEMRKRANKTRRFARFSILGIIAIVTILILFFLISANTGQFEYMSFGGFLISKTGDDLVTEELTADEAILRRFEELNTKIIDVQAQVRAQESFQADVLLSISLTIVRMASVFLAVYLVQILVSFTRYQFRISDHLDSVGDALEISEGNLDSLDKVATVVTSLNIEFGKMPKTPTEQSVELIRELVNKLPSK